MIRLYLISVVALLLSGCHLLLPSNAPPSSDSRVDAGPTTSQDLGDTISQPILGCASARGLNINGNMSVCQADDAITSCQANQLCAAGWHNCNPVEFEGYMALLNDPIPPAPAWLSACLSRSSDEMTNWLEPCLNCDPVAAGTALAGDCGFAPQMRTIPRPIAVQTSPTPNQIAGSPLVGSRCGHFQAVSANSDVRAAMCCRDRCSPTSVVAEVYPGNDMVRCYSTTQGLSQCMASTLCGGFLQLCTGAQYDARGGNARISEHGSAAESWIAGCTIDGTQTTVGVCAQCNGATIQPIFDAPPCGIQPAFGISAAHAGHATFTMMRGLKTSPTGNYLCGFWQALSSDQALLGSMCCEPN